MEPDSQPSAPLALGLHTVTCQHDLVFICLVGTLNLEEAQAFHGLVAKALQQHGSAYVLADASRGGSLPSETRRWIAEWNKQHRVNAVAVFGASLLMRTMVTLVLKAIALLGPRGVPATFVKTETEARDWLKSLRTA